MSPKATLSLEKKEHRPERNYNTEEAGRNKKTEDREQKAKTANQWGTKSQISISAGAFTECRVVSVEF